MVTRKVRCRSKPYCLIEHGVRNVVRQPSIVSSEELEEKRELKIAFKFHRLITRFAFVGHLENGNIRVIGINKEPFIVGDNINTRKRKPTLKKGIKTIYNEGWDSGNFRPIMTRKILITANNANIEEKVIMGL